MRTIAGALVVLCCLASVTVPSVTVAQQAGPSPLEIARALGASDPRHAPSWDEGEVALRGPADRTVTIDAAGAAWAEEGTSVRLGLRAIGRGRVVPVGSGAVRIEGPEARAVRGDGIEEWWRSLPTGLEHGVDLARRPAGEGELVLLVGADGLVATLADERTITLGTASTPNALVYSGLEVLDADGARLPARLDVVDGAIAIRVDDRGARYPVSVDPVLATLEATITGPSNRFGWSVSVSADGSRAAVSGPTGAPAHVSVFLRTGTTWALEQRFDGAESFFGYNVALSANGDVLAIAAPAIAPSTGAFRVATRTGTTWSALTTVVASDGMEGDFFGFSVALNRDATTLAVGAIAADGPAGSNQGAVYVFDRGPSGWTEVARLEHSGAFANDQLGYSVAIDDAGDRVVAGAYFGQLPGVGQVGTAWVFARGSAGWAEEARLDPELSGLAIFGVSCAIDPTGTRAIVGGSVDMGSRGMAAVFVRSGSTWTLESTLRASDAEASDEFGHWVRFAVDGTQAWISARSDDTAAGANAGSVRLFVRSGTTWTEGLTIPGTIAGGELGYGFDVARDGSRLVAGAWNALTTYVYTLAASNGDPCLASSSCASGFCTDGVCCDSACGDGAADCQACTAALTGGADGTCAPMTAGAECRASAGTCDPAEICDGVARSCPAPVFAAPGTSCRASAGACDPAEVCDGASAVCPGDVRSPPGLPCGGDVGPCTVPAVCDGIAPACPSPLARAAGTVCLPADTSNPCDTDDVCDGTSDACLPAFAPATQACGSAVSDVCDAPDHCSGSSGECIAALLVDVECRPSTAACDAPETCTGASPACPADVTACMADAGTDAGGMMAIDAAMADAGAADGGPSDAGAGADGGTAPSTGGCTCRAERRGASPVLALVVLALIAARRRR